MMRSFLSLVSLALLSSAAVSQTCPDGVCPAPGAGRFGGVVQSATNVVRSVLAPMTAVRNPVYGSTGAPQVAFAGVPQRMAGPEVVFAGGLLRAVGVESVTVRFAEPGARSLARPFGGRFRR